MDGSGAHSGQGRHRYDRGREILERASDGCLPNFCWRVIHMLIKEVIGPHTHVIPPFPSRPSTKWA